MGQAASSASVGALCGEAPRLIGSDAPSLACGAKAAGRDRDTPLGVERLLAECPRDLAAVIRETEQWDALRVRPWLSASAWRGLQRSLQRCRLPRLMERYADVEAGGDGYHYTVPPVIPWDDLDADHVVSAGQVFVRDNAGHDKLRQLRKLGLQTLRQGKLGVVFLAGGSNLRLGGGEPPIACSRKALQLCSGKSMFQLFVERLRRVTALAGGMLDASSRGSAVTSVVPRPSVPVFVMTSRLTHRNVVEHFESNRYFGLPARDVFFFEQSVMPVLSDDGKLLPQSLGGEFAHAPGGTGQLLVALAGSSALEQMRDRGVECLHVLGTDNLLARLCDPVFIGFCRELDVDCACKVTERLSPEEDLDLFCIRQSPVTTQFADIEESACGLALDEAPPNLIAERCMDGSLKYSGVMSSFFLTVGYIEEVVTRPARIHRCSRVVPYLDFYLAHWGLDAPPPDDPVPVESTPLPQPLLGGTVPKQSSKSVSSVMLGTWPAETSSLDLSSQRMLLSAAAEIKAAAGDSGLEDLEEAWRCDVSLDSTGPTVAVLTRSAKRGGDMLPESLPTVDASAGERWNAPLLCSLVVPSQANAKMLEAFLLDYFAYTDRAIAFEVARCQEFSPVRELTGMHSPDNARAALSTLHRSWLVSAGVKLVEEKPGACLEVSPLLSYEGEGLLPNEKGGFVVKLPAHLPGPGEMAQADEELGEDDDTIAPPDEVAADGLDTRNYYLQEYAQRLHLSDSHAPQFRTLSRDGPVVAGQSIFGGTVRQAGLPNSSLKSLTSDQNGGRRGPTG